MPITPTYPGVYIQELPSTVHTITGVTTSNTAFIDEFVSGPVGEAVEINSFSEFQNIFGGLDASSESSYQIMQFFLNGGSTAYVVRIAPENAVPAEADFPPAYGITSPSSGPLQAGNTLQFSTTVPSPVWSIIGQGTINATGLYTAPAAVTAVGVDTVVASNASDCSISAQQSVSYVPAQVSLTPAVFVANAASETQAFTPTISQAGTASQTPTWAIVDGKGNVVTTAGAVSNGTYTAPGTLPTSPEQYFVQVTAANQTAQAVLVVLPAAPTGNATVTTTLTSQTADKGTFFLAALGSGVTSPTKVTYNWTCSDSTVSLPSSTDDGFCYKPTTPNFSGVVTVGCTIDYTSGGTATSATSTAWVYISPANTVTITNPTYTVEIGRSYQFNATVVGDSNNQVTWTLGPGSPGLIDDGFYEAPQMLGPNQTVSVIATSVLNPGQSQTFSLQLVPGPSRLSIKAANPGSWSNNLYAAVYMQTSNSQPFGLVVQLQDATGKVIQSESYQALNLTIGDPNYAPSIVNAASQLIQLIDNGTAVPPPKFVIGPPAPTNFVNLTGGTDGAFNPGEYAQTLTPMLTPDGSPLTAITPDIVNLLCLPGVANLGTNTILSVYSAAIEFCTQTRAFFIADIPPSSQVSNVSQMIQFAQTVFTTSEYGAVYYPRVTIPDPLQNYRMREVGVSGTMAGIYATTDLNRGVWKAPAGINATLAGAAPVVALTDTDNGKLNPLAINAIRKFAVYGVVSWGTRTLAGADELADQYKYIPVRRVAEYIENSLYSGLQWAVFEPNDEPLWASIRLNVTAFMDSLFRQGAFQGSSPKSAYFVACDSTTTSQYDIDSGVVNVVVGFAPLKPAEFVVIQLQQIAGQSAS